MSIPLPCSDHSDMVPRANASRASIFSLIISRKVIDHRPRTTDETTPLKITRPGTVTAENVCIFLNFKN